MRDVHWLVKEIVSCLVVIVKKGFLFSLEILVYEVKEKHNKLMKFINSGL